MAEEKKYNMTPIETLIKEIQKEIEIFTPFDRGVVAGLEIAVIKAQSLLPVEQQFNCEFAEDCVRLALLGSSDYFFIDDGKDSRWGNASNSEFISTPELLQLFTQQKDKDGK